MREPRLFVEAKALREKLDDDRWTKQIMGYASVAGVKWVVLTNGNEYHIYNSHASVPVEEKLFRRIELSSDEPGAAEALALLSKAQLRDNQIDVLWRADFVDRQVRAALEGLFGAEPPKDFVRLVRKRITALGAADIKASLARALVTVDYPIPLPSAAPAEASRWAQSTEPDVKAKAAGELGVKTPWRHVTMLDLISHGLITPPFGIQTRFKGELLSALIESDGSVSWNGDRHESLSLAGGPPRGSTRLVSARSLFRPQRAVTPCADKAHRPSCRMGDLRPTIA